MCNTPFCWSVEITDANGQPNLLNRSAGQTVVNDNQNESLLRNKWLFGDNNSQEYKRLESFRFFNTNPKITSWSDLLNQHGGDLSINIFNNDASDSAETMILQVGDQFNSPTNQNTRKQGDPWIFQWSKLRQETRDYLLAQDNMQTTPEWNSVPGLGNATDSSAWRNFTFTPIYPNPQQGFNFNGIASLLVSIGPDHYDLSGDFDVPSDKVQLFTSNNDFKPITELFKSGFQNQNTETQDTYEVWVGSIADWILLQDNTKHMDIKIDGHNGNALVENSDILLSQYIYFKNNTTNKDYIGVLTNDKQVFVSGSPQTNADLNPAFNESGAVINGSNGLGKGDTTKKQSKFLDGLIDISSNYIASDITKPSTQVAGLTIENPLSRQSGAVQLNTDYFDGMVDVKDWFTSDGDDPDERWANRLGRFIYAIENQNTISLQDNQGYRFDAQLGKNTAITGNISSKLFDNQILGWQTAADGFESQSPQVVSAKNFIKVNDDAIKMMSRNQTFQENTIHLGKSGAGVSFGYGVSNGSITDTNSRGLFAHRIINNGGDNPSDDNFALSGFIADWATWSEKLINNKGAGINPQLNNVNIDYTYIPSMKNSSSNDVNVLFRSGTTSGVSNLGARSGFVGDNAPPNQTFTQGGYGINNFHNFLASTNQQGQQVGTAIGTYAIEKQPFMDSSFLEGVTFSDWDVNNNDRKFLDTSNLINPSSSDNPNTPYQINFTTHSFTDYQQSNPLLINGPDGLGGLTTTESAISDISIQEGDTDVFTFSTFNDLPVQWSLPQWGDNELFVIDSQGNLTLKKPLDFENPVDIADENILFDSSIVSDNRAAEGPQIANNIYAITVKAEETDNPMNVNFQTVRINVINDAADDNQLTQPILSANANERVISITTSDTNGTWMTAKLVNANINQNLGLKFSDQISGNTLGSIGAVPGVENNNENKFLLRQGQSFEVGLSGIGLSESNPDSMVELSETADGINVKAKDSNGNNLIEVLLTPDNAADSSDQLDISRAQINDYDTIYDFRNIGASGAKVRFDIQAISGYKNKLYLARFDGDPLTNRPYTIAGAAVSNTDEFRSAVKDNLINFSGVEGGELTVGGGNQLKEYSFEWTLNQSDSGFYAPVLISETGNLFTMGADSAYGTSNAKVLAKNVFGFEDILGGGNQDCNDIIIKATMI